MYLHLINNNYRSPTRTASQSRTALKQRTYRKIKFMYIYSKSTRRNKTSFRSRSIVYYLTSKSRSKTKNKNLSLSMSRYTSRSKILKLSKCLTRKDVLNKIKDRIYKNN